MVSQRLQVLNYGASFNADMARAFASVPEPGTVGLLGLAGIGFLARRRKIKMLEYRARLW